MSRIANTFLWLFFLSSVALAEERKNLSIDDLITGFKKRNLFYFEMLFENGKYSQAFDKCLNTKPADFNWIREHCKKDPGFKHMFECSEDGKIKLVWFVYESQDKCEEVREAMKNKIDAYNQQ